MPKQKVKAELCEDRVPATAPNKCWSMDFLSDQSFDGRKIRVLSIVDNARGHVAVINQTSYVRSFDVEVAQSSFIADPKVDALTYGSVLDVRVASVLTERVVHSFRRAITKLEGADPGDDASRWEAWLAGRRNAPAR